MTMKRAILEMGMGNDLHGEDYTKAAERAIKDALHHSSLSFIRTLNIDKNQLFVNVTIGVQKPENVNTTELKKLLSVGVVSIKAIKGGLDVPDHENNDHAVIASAAIEVMLDV